MRILDKWGGKNRLLLPSLSLSPQVLSPEELLFRCVEAVNFTHNPAHAQMDVKLRSLICLGLNEQVREKERSGTDLWAVL